MKMLLLLVLGCSAPLMVSLSAFHFGGLKERASEATRELAAEYEVPPEMMEQARRLASSLGLSGANLSRYANEGLKALGRGDDVEALGFLDRVGAAQLSAGQAAAYEDLKLMVDSYVLRRNFEGTEGASGPLGTTLAALNNKEYGAAAQQLQQVMSAVQPTGSQLQILSSLRDQYTAWAAQPE